LFRKFVKLLLFMGVLGVVALLSATVLFPVRDCRAEGRTSYTEEQFADALGLGEEKLNLFTANKAALTERIHAALPYARVVKIARRLPGTLVLTVEARAPALAQEQDGLWWLLTGEALLLGTEEDMPEGLLPLAGAPLEAPAAGQYASWANAFTAPRDVEALLICLRESALWPGVTALRIATAAFPDAVYQDRILMRFGAIGPSVEGVSQEAALREKLRVAEASIAKADAQNPLQRGILDLSIHGQAHLTPRWDEGFLR